MKLLFKKILKAFGIIKGRSTSSIYQLKLLRKMPESSVCLEIGVWKGDFSQKIIDNVQPKMLFLLDPWDYQPEFKGRIFGGAVAKSQKDMDDIYDGVHKRFKESNNVEILRGYSDKLSNKFDDLYFDWIYIDGNHFYEYVLNDLKNYFSKVKVNGLITGDDLNWSTGDLKGVQPVKDAVEDFLNEYTDRAKLIEIIGDQFIIQKIKE